MCGNMLHEVMIKSLLFVQYVLDVYQPTIGQQLVSVVTRY